MAAVDPRSRTRTALALALVCATIAPAAAADLRGFVTDGPAGLLVFQPCRGAALAQPMFRLSDKSPDTALTAGVTAVRQVMEDRDRPLYVEFAGDAAAGAVTVRRFHRSIGHVLACAGAPKDIPAGARIHAAGQEPGWRLLVAGSEARLELAPGKAVRFPAAAFAAPVNAGRTRVFDAWSSSDGGTVRAEITEELCLDEAAETASGARVTVRYGSTEVEGCAGRF